MYALVLKSIFLNLKYLSLSIALFAFFLILLLSTSEFLFFEPILSLSVHQEDIPNFLLIIITAILTALVIPMTIYKIVLLQKNPKRVGSGFLGSIIGTSAGVCSCGAIGFSVISTFGAVGGIVTAFLTNYEIPLRLLAIGILGYTLFDIVKSLSRQCSIRPQ